MYNEDNCLKNFGGIICFSIHDELFHKQGSLHRNEDICFVQWIFYDPQKAVTDLRQRHDSIRSDILCELMNILRNCNPFIPFYKTTRERLNEQTDSEIRILLNPRLELIMKREADCRRKNLSTSNEIAVLIPNETESTKQRNLVLAQRHPQRNHRLENVHETHAVYMPLAYPLLFPKGDHGWRWGLKLRGEERKNKRLQQFHFYKFRLHYRRRERTLTFYGGQLFQQYVVDIFAACEKTRLSWLRIHQNCIRADAYRDLMDSMAVTDHLNPAEQGRQVILPASFINGDRFMQRCYQNSMTILRKLGKPSLFITFTANPKWPEITRELLGDQQSTDHPDLVVRVFYLKFRALIEDLKNHAFGPYAGHVDSIEYQKRGLPHAHILLFLGDGKPDYTKPEVIDEVICAEFPDPSWDPQGALTRVITANMLHGPCGVHDPTSPCMLRKGVRDVPKCSKEFPKPFVEQSVNRGDGYPQYRRRDDGRSIVKRVHGQDVKLTNQ